MNRRWGCGCGGCLGSVLMTLLVIVVVGYFFAYRPIQSFLAGFGTPVQSQTAQTTPGRQPVPTTSQAGLTTADVQRFVRVRRSVRAAMGSSFGGVQKVFTDLQNGQGPNALTILGVLREAAGSVGAARAAQQAALAREGMNLPRYNYVRGEVNKALGVPDIDFQKVAQAVNQGRLPDLNTTIRPPDPRTEKLVTPFKSELTVTAPLGLLGL